MRVYLLSSSSTSSSSSSSIARRQKHYTPPTHIIPHNTFIYSHTSILKIGLPGKGSIFFFGFFLSLNIYSNAKKTFGMSSIKPTHGIWWCMYAFNPNNNTQPKFYSSFTHFIDPKYISIYGWSIVYIIRVYF